MGFALLIQSGFARNKARRSNGLGALLLFTAVYMVLQLGSRIKTSDTRWL